MVEFLISLFEDILFTFAEKKLMSFKQEKAYKDFLQQLKDWSNEYILRNEHTIIAGSDFYNYIKYHNSIQNIIFFIRQPQKQKEDEFIDSIKNKATTYLGEKKTLTYDDSRAINEFIDGIFKKTYDYYQSLISDDAAFINYKVSQVEAIVQSIGEDVKEIKEAVAIKKAPLSRKIYTVPENTIIRKVAPYKKIQESYFFSLNSEDFLEVCIREKRVVLLGEAGCGKSIALNQLSSAASNTKYYPLLYNLNNYTDNSIEKIVFSVYPEVDLEAVFLIFDAYDEIEEQNRNRFARKIGEFAKNNPNTIILISSRNNFYKFSNDDGNGGLFDNFKEYGIAPITHSDIKNYILINMVDYDRFWSEVYTNELHHLVYIPFYLRELINIYKRKNTLPQKSRIMEEIICNRFNSDCQKYIRTKDLENYEEEIFSCLEKLAFAIQCLRVTKISNINYQKLFNKTQRDIIGYSGVFSKDTDNNWSFDHNNFREYLTAKYINKLPLSDLQKLICNKYGKIINSWVNVLSYLVLIRENNDLLSLLMDNDPEMIIRFERSRVDENIRNEISIKILDDFSHKSMWLSHGLNSGDTIAKFGQSKKLCEHLLNQISNPINFKTQSNALSVLSEFTESFGMETEIRNLLFECLKSDKTRIYEKSKILETIAALRLQTFEITSYIVENFNHTLLPHYRLSVLRYLNETNCFEDYIDLYTEEYEVTEGYFDESTSIRYEILDVFSKCHRSESLHKVIKALSKHVHTYSTDEETYKVIISNATKMYQNGESEIFDYIVESLIDSDIHNRLFFKNCILFFDKTNTRIDAFMALLEMDLHFESYKILLPLESLADDSCRMFLLTEYIKEPDKYVDAIKTFALRLKEDDPLLEKYKEALISNGIDLPKRRIPFDHQKAMQEGQQYCFDILFDKEKYCALVKKLVLSIGNEDLTFADLDDADYHPINYNNEDNKKEEYALLQLYYCLTRYNNDKDVVFSTISEISNWDNFIIAEADYLLEHDRQFNINDEQKTFFRNYCEEQLNVIDFQNEFNYEGTTLSCSIRLMRFVFFSEYFNFEYAKKVYNEMLMLPSCLFNGVKGSEYGKIPPYIYDKYSPLELQEQIKANLQIDTLCEEVIVTYIRYCKNNNLDFAITSAEKICLTSSDSWHKRTAVEYLYVIKGLEYVYEHFLNTEDKDLLEHIIALTINHKNIRLKNRLEELSSRSPEDKRYIANLIFLNSKYALEAYLETCKKTMKSTSIPHTSHVDSVLEMICVISDIDLLDTVGELRVLLYTDGFEDLDSFGLRNSLYKAYQNLSIYDFDSVKDHLNEALNNPNICDGEKSFCNMLLRDIQNTNDQKNDVAWSIEDIKRFLSANE